MTWAHLWFNLRMRSSPISSFHALFALFLLAAAGCTTAVRDHAPSSQIPSTIASSLVALGRTVKPVETEALYAPLAEKEPYGNVIVVRDQRYGAEQRHLLDVFTPSTFAASRPVLMFVHGGAFTRGNKRTGVSPFYDNIMLWAAKNGMVGVNMTYRLAPENTWPAAQHDIAAAVKWVKQHIAAHGGDPKRIFLMGHSAGAAHVAQYVGHAQFHAEPGSALAGALIISGLFDPGTAEFNPPIQAYFGADRSVLAQRSALPGMALSKVPTLLAYAELDPPDFHAQSEQAKKALCAAGRCPTFIVLKGHSHMSEIHSINTADVALTDLMKRFVLSN
jgi:acetyl esterase/lipase